MEQLKSGQPPTVERLASWVELYLSLVKEDEPRGLALLRAMRQAVADLYAAMVGLRGSGDAPALRSREPASAEREVDIHSRLLARLPRELYWSALLPLTWKSVGDVGNQQLAERLLDIFRDLMTIPITPDAGADPASVIYRLQFDLIVFGRPMLEVL